MVAAQEPSDFCDDCVEGESLSLLVRPLGDLGDRVGPSESQGKGTWLGSHADDEWLRCVTNACHPYHLCLPAPVVYLGSPKRRRLVPLPKDC